MRVTYPGGLLPGLGRQLALLLQLRKKDGAEAEDGADAEAAQPADDERGEVLQCPMERAIAIALIWLGIGSNNAPGFLLTPPPPLLLASPRPPRPP